MRCLRQDSPKQDAILDAVDVGVVNGAAEHFGVASESTCYDAAGVVGPAGPSNGKGPSLPIAVWGGHKGWGIGAVPTIAVFHEANRAV